MSAGVPTLDYAGIAVRRPLLEIPTFRNWLRTLCWTLGAVGVCGIIYCFDKWGLTLNIDAPRDVDYRMFKNPAELPMRIFGLPHFIIATMFVLTSRRMQSRRNQVYLALLAAVSVVVCYVFHRVGATENPIALILFYFYFLIHGIRDDAYFYKSYGDMPTEAGPTHQRIMTVLQLLALGLLFSFIWPTYTYLSRIKPRYAHPVLQNFFPADWGFTIRLAIMFVPMVLIAVIAMTLIARQFSDGWAGLWRAHRPILAVFIISIGIVLLTLIIGPATFNVVVLMHFVGWYIFALYLLARRPEPEGPLGWWQWMRSTRRGFMTLHLGLAALVTVLIAVSVYCFGKQDVLEHIVGSKSFFYWTIAHVTLSFMPR